MSSNFPRVSGNWTISRPNPHPIIFFSPSYNLSFRGVKRFPCNKFPLQFVCILCHNQLQRACLFRLQASDDRDIEISSTSPNSNDDHLSSSTKEEEEEEAKMAVFEFLQELGASKEDSLEIASNSSKYVNMLINSVRELDELSLWDSWSTQRGAECTLQLSFKDKVYRISKYQKDRGMIPLLESNGLSLPNATHVARYLSSQTLPDVINKVKYVKEIFFSDSDDEGLIGRKVCLMMMHLSVPADEDLQQTLSFFEKIGARRGGLDLLGSKDVSFRYLIESFPRLLLLQLESNMKQLVDFFENIGVSKGCMRNIFLLFPPVIFYSIEKNIKPRLRAFEKVGVRDEDCGKMLLKYPWVLSSSIQENYKDVLSFFDMEKVPKASVERAIKRWPHLLGCSVSRIKVMVEQFGELGVESKKLGRVIASSPQLLLRKPQEFLEVVGFLGDLGLDEETISQILCRCPEIFATSIEKTLKKKLDYLNSIGVSKNHFPRVIRKYPEFFVSDFDRTLLPRIKYLMKAGLSKREVAVMICKFSPLLGYSIEEVLRPKLEFLVKTMEKPLKDVVEYPRYFSYSLEKKIRPRYWVLKGRKVESSLKDMLGKNDEEFAAEFMVVERMLVDVPPSPSLE